MTWALDLPVRFGGVDCVPIVETKVTVRADTNRFTGHGKKQPVLFLLFQKGEVTALDLRGRVQSVEDIERQYPGAIAAANERLMQGADR